MRQMKPMSKNNYSVATINVDNRSLLLGVKPHDYSLELPAHTDKKPVASVLVQ
jgi:hypothetical protein